MGLLGPVPNFEMGERREPGFGGYAARSDIPNLNMDPRQFPGGMGHHYGGGDGFNDRRDEMGPGRRFPDEFRGSQMGSNLDRPIDGPMDRPTDRPMDISAYWASN